LARQIQRWYSSRQGSKCTLTQGQSNKAFEKPDFPIQTTSAASLCELISCRLRKSYFAVLLRPEVGWFDILNPND